MKISENRRLRGEKKAMARHEHQQFQNSRHEKKFYEFARLIAQGESAAGRIDFTQQDTILKQAGKTVADLQEAVEAFRSGELEI
ncbi:MAG: hypothetical protein IPM29_10105 [Planctomycetes bacterium]|nr:hypothetical protein [Planctomycetota bacterium]